MEHKDKISIRKEFWDELYTELGRRGGGKNESGAFLLAAEKSNEISHVLFYDDLEPGCLDYGGIHLTQRAFIKLSDYCLDNGLVVKVDVHTHPYGNVKQSYIDRENPMVKVKGHLAIIIPFFAQRETYHFAQIGVYEFQGGGFNWTSHSFSDRFSISGGRSFDKDSISRLALAFFERDPALAALGQSAFERIEEMLKEYRLTIFCGNTITRSVAQQVALVTMVNVGKRCFQGGIFIQLETDSSCLLPGFGNKTLETVLAEAGAIVNPQVEYDTGEVIMLGEEPVDQFDGWRLVVNNWSFALVPPGHKLDSILQGGDCFPLGGVMGAAVTVGSVFLRLAKFDASIGHSVVGLSLWRPDLKWYDADAQGPAPKYFPNQLWMLGLGHLGQAYAWTVGMIPFVQPGDLKVKLQDDDRVTLANIDSGMLSEKGVIGKKKARVAAWWLEDRGIMTTVVERRFDKTYAKQATDPSLLLGGVDNVEARVLLTGTGVKGVFDSGLGAGLNFDMVRFNVFPNQGVSTADFYKLGTDQVTTPFFKSLTHDLVGCGYTLGIASAFTGCAAAAVTISELVRSYNQGIKLSHLYFSIREVNDADVGVLGKYGTEMLTGFCELQEGSVEKEVLIA